MRAGPGCNRRAVPSATPRLCEEGGWWRDSERSARARHKLLGKALRGALWRVVGCGGRVEVRARAWGLSKVFEIGAQALSMSRARAPTPTLTHERTCTMPRRHDQAALSTRVDARVDAL